MGGNLETIGGGALKERPELRAKLDKLAEQMKQQYGFTEAQEKEYRERMEKMVAAMTKEEWTGLLAEIGMQGAVGVLPDAIGDPLREHVVGKPERFEEFMQRLDDLAQEVAGAKTADELAKERARRAFEDTKKEQDKAENPGLFTELWRSFVKLGKKTWEAIKGFFGFGAKEKKESDEQAEDALDEAGKDKPLVAKDGLDPEKEKARMTAGLDKLKGKEISSGVVRFPVFVEKLGYCVELALTVGTNLMVEVRDPVTGAKNRYTAVFEYTGKKSIIPTSKEELADGRQPVINSFQLQNWQKNGDGKLDGQVVLQVNDNPGKMKLSALLAGIPNLVAGKEFAVKIPGKDLQFKFGPQEGTQNFLEVPKPKKGAKETEKAPEINEQQEEKTEGVLAGLSLPKGLTDRLNKVADFFKDKYADVEEFAGAMKDTVALNQDVFLAFGKLDDSLRKLAKTKKIDAQKAVQDQFSAAINDVNTALKTWEVKKINLPSELAEMYGLLFAERETAYIEVVKGMFNPQAERASFDEVVGYEKFGVRKYLGLETPAFDRHVKIKNDLASLSNRFSKLGEQSAAKYSLPDLVQETLAGMGSTYAGAYKEKEKLVDTYHSEGDAAVNDQLDKWLEENKVPKFVRLGLREEIKDTIGIA